MALGKQVSVHEQSSVEAVDLLHAAQGLERAGRFDEALHQYEAAVSVAEATQESRVLAEALRRLAVLRYLRNEPDAARALCHQSARVAFGADNEVLAAEAFNTLASVDLQTGAMELARENYQRALGLGGHDRELTARVEQNLGVLANIQGALDDAWTHYRRSLAAYAAAGNVHGRAIAYHNLAMVSMDQGRWGDAENYFTRSREIAESTGDLHLQGLCLVNQAELDVELQRYEQSRAGAEKAIDLFTRLGVLALKATAYRVIGMVYRETGRPALAESRLRTAMEMATEARSLLAQGEVARELAVLCQTSGRNQEALTLLNTAYRLFGQIDARVDLVNVTGKVALLENTYLAVVKEWGQSIETADSYTHGHCDRVGLYAEQVGRMLGLRDEAIKTIRIGAWLHDLGKVRVPHEILNKPGPLTQHEYEVMKMHTVWGVEMLKDISFPWDIKPIVRWHHERYDGTGYPDRLKGEEIPLHAQIIGIADVFDALTTTRAYRGAMSHDDAVAEIERCRHWWREDVVQAFMQSVAIGAEVSDRQPAPGTTTDAN